MEDSLAARELIERAFGLAKQSAKPEWWIMAVPVLKNRLLQLTKGSFKESDFGAVSYRDFLQKNTDTIRIDDSNPPGAVMLRSAEGIPQQGQTRPSHRRDQIRPDLWRAILDYSSGNRFQWNAANRVAEPAPVESEGPLLPTISPDDLKEWKNDFLSGRTGANEQSDQLEAWVDEGLPTAALPVVMRPAWNKYLKRKVHDRLKEWFDAQSITPPPINEEVNYAISRTPEHDALRAFVLECVKLMSKEELEKLPIPSSVALRAKSKL
jgi:hypothetical protein